MKIEIREELGQEMDRLLRERKQIEAEEQALARRKEINVAKIELLGKFCRNGSSQEEKAQEAPQHRLSADEVPAVTVRDAAWEAMKYLGQFTDRTVEQYIRERYPVLDFNGKSLRKPRMQAVDKGWIRQVKPNMGNKSQAVYEWVKK